MSNPIDLGIGQPYEERFWSKVSVSDSSCWLWTAGKVDGYGTFRLGNSKQKAHRIVARALGMDMSLEIDHRCFNRACVRPDHLRPVSHKQNMEHARGPYRNSTTGVRGVFWHKRNKKYVARVGRVSLGYFVELAEAEKAVIAARRELFTHDDGALT